jgi:hypothetical protein
MRRQKELSSRLPVFVVNALWISVTCAWMSPSYTIPEHAAQYDSRPLSHSSTACLSLNAQQENWKSWRYQFETSIIPPSWWALAWCLLICFRRLSNNCRWVNSQNLYKAFFRWTWFDYSCQRLTEFEVPSCEFRMLLFGRRVCSTETVPLISAIEMLWRDDRLKSTCKTEVTQYVVADVAWWMMSKMIPAVLTSRMRSRFFQWQTVTTHSRTQRVVSCNHQLQHIFRSLLTAYVHCCWKRCSSRKNESSCKFNT